MFLNATARALTLRTAVEQRQLKRNGYYASRDDFAFVSSLKLKRRMLCVTFIMHKRLCKYDQM